MSEDATYDFIDITKEPSKVDLAAWIVLAKKRFHKGYLAQYFDIQRLRESFGRLNIGEYYIYQLANKDDAAQEEFLGNKVRMHLYRKVNDAKWIPVANSKLGTSSRLREHDLPAPVDYALYHPSQTIEGVHSLRSKEELAAYLRDGIAFPFFSKPLTGSISLGVVAARSYDSANDRLMLSGNKAVKIDRFVEGVSHFFEKGYLFQELLEPHPDVTRVCGHRLSSVRAMVLFEDHTDPELYRTIWKIPVGDNVADNAWREGNLLAAIDHETGEVTRVVTGWGTEEHEVEDHPDTGARIKGMKLPDWERFREVCDASARLFPGLRLQAWDVAMTTRGPVMLEINGAGDFSIPQRATGRGLMTGRFRDFVRSWKLEELIELVEAEKKPRRGLRKWLPF